MASGAMKLNLSFRFRQNVRQQINAFLNKINKGMSPCSPHYVYCMHVSLNHAFNNTIRCTVQIKIAVTGPEK